MAKPLVQAPAHSCTQPALTIKAGMRWSMTLQTLPPLLILFQALWILIIHYTMAFLIDTSLLLCRIRMRWAQNSCSRIQNSTVRMMRWQIPRCGTFQYSWSTRRFVLAECSIHLNTCILIRHLWGIVLSTVAGVLLMMFLRLVLQKLTHLIFLLCAAVYFWASSHF